MYKLNSNNAKEKGSVIIFTILILGSMLTITLALVSIFAPKLNGAKEAGAGSVGAIYAADSALEWCLYINRGNGSSSAPTMANAATYNITRGGVASGCTTSPLNEQIVGTYHGVSRSLYVTSP